MHIVNKLTLVPKGYINVALMLFSFGLSMVLYWCNKVANLITNYLSLILCFSLLSSAEAPLSDVLCDFRKNSDSGISSWDWNLSGQHSTYHALFPRAWTVYDGMLL